MAHPVPESDCGSLLRQRPLTQSVVQTSGLPQHTRERQWGGSWSRTSILSCGVKPDHRSNPIQYIQIIRGWLEGTEAQEQVYSVPSKE